MSSQRPARLAIIGCGYIVEMSSGLALRRIGWVPSVLVDTSPKRLEVVARKLGSKGNGTIKVSNWRSVAGEFDAALVALPHALHGPIGTALVESGKHVFMEKPLATTGAECRAMTTAADQRGVILSVGLLRRYLRIARWTKALLDSETLGEIQHFEAREGLALNADTGSEALLNRKTAGGGVLLDTGAHTLDLLQWWFGALAPLNYRDDSEGGVEADCVLDCRLLSGGTGRVELSRTRDLRNTVWIEGTRGFVEVHLYKNEVLAGSPNALAFKHDGVGASGMKPQFFPELFDAELRDFMLSVSDGTQLGISGHEGTKSVDLIERCYAVRQPLVQPWVTSASDGTESLRKLPFGSKVLVTGGTGFIGGRLVERLIQENGAHVRCIIRNIGRATRVARFPIEIVRKDLSNPDDIDSAVEGMDYVFHCAYDLRSRAQNIDGLRNLARACAKHSVRRLVHVSSFAVYAPFPDGPLTEGTRDGDRSVAYTKAKLELEEIVLDFARDGEVPATVVQPTIVFGPFCKPWTNAIAEMLIYGEVVLPDRGEGVCNAVYIDDLVDGLMLAAVCPAAVGERFIISGPLSVTWSTFFSEFARSLETKPPTYWPRDQISKASGGVLRSLRLAVADPRRLVKAIVTWNPAREILQAGLDAMPGPVRTAVMNYYFGGGGRRGGQTFLPDRQALAIYTSRTTVDCEKARSRLGYRPRFDFHRGMALTSAYLKWAYSDVRLSAAAEPNKLNRNPSQHFET